MTYPTKAKSVQVESLIQDTSYAKIFPGIVDPPFHFLLHDSARVKGTVDLGLAISY